MTRVEQALEKWRKSNERLARAHTVLATAIKRGAADAELSLLRRDVADLTKAATADLEVVRAEVGNARSLPRPEGD